MQLLGLETHPAGLWPKAWHLQWALPPHTWMCWVTRSSPGPSRQASQGVAAGRGPQLASDAFLPTWLSGPKPATHRPVSLRARRYEGNPRDPTPYMYSETGALEMVWAGGCRLVWLPSPLL